MMMIMVVLLIFQMFHSKLNDELSIKK